MASVVVTFKIMPEDPDQDLIALRDKADKLITAFGGAVGKTEEQPVAFGLKAVLIYFVMDEGKGSTDAVEAQICELPGVNSVELTDVRRTIG